MPLRVVQIIPDDRDVRRQYDVPEPFFGTAPSALLEGFASLPDEVEVHVVACSRRPMAVPEKLADNIDYHQILIPGGYRRTLYVETVRKVRQCIRRIGPDVVHGQGTEEYPALCAAMSGFPNCVTVHGNMRAVARKKNYRPFPAMHLAAFLETVALRKTDAVVCLSSYTKRNVEKLARKTVTIPNAVDSRFFNLRCGMISDGCSVDKESRNDKTGDRKSSSTHQPIIQSTEESAKPNLLCIGTVVSYKNQAGLIHALEPLAERFDFRLRIVGGGRMDDPYVRQVETLCQRHGWCEWVGSVSREGIMQELASATALVHPSLEDNCPMVVLEAMAAGIPVLASAIGGIPDLVRDGETGRLFDPAGGQGMADAVEELLEDATLAQRLGEAARRHAERFFAPTAIAREHVDFYRETILRQ
jgi:glycosyltransferase involved in cell wall biosynthesis